MTEKLATLSQEDNISIITLDDGKVNAFSYDMLAQVHSLLDEIPQKTGALVIKGRDGIFSGGINKQFHSLKKKLTKMNFLIQHCLQQDN